MTFLVTLAKLYINGVIGIDQLDRFFIADKQLPLEELHQTPIFVQRESTDYSGTQMGDSTYEYLSVYQKYYSSMRRIFGSLFAREYIIIVIVLIAFFLTIAIFLILYFAVINKSFYKEGIVQFNS